MKKTLINEVRKFQKIAGILKENLGEADNQAVPGEEGGSALFHSLVEDPNFVIFSDNGDWEYTRFGLIDKDGKSYFVELEGEESDDDVQEFKPGVTAKAIIKQGVEKGYFEKVENAWYYEDELEEELFIWLNSLLSSPL